MKKIILLAGVFALVAFVLLDTGQVGGISKEGQDDDIDGMILTIFEPDEPMLSQPGEGEAPPVAYFDECGLNKPKPLDGQRVMFQPAEGGDKPKPLDEETHLLKDVVGLNKPSVISFLILIGANRPIPEEIWL